MFGVRLMHLHMSTCESHAHFFAIYLHTNRQAYFHAWVDIFIHIGFVYVFRVSIDCDVIRIIVSDAYQCSFSVYFNNQNFCPLISCSELLFMYIS